MSCAQGFPRDGGCDCGDGFYNSGNRNCDCFERAVYNTTNKKCQCPSDYPAGNGQDKKCYSEAEIGAFYATANPFPVWAIAVLSVVGAGVVAAFAYGIWRIPRDDAERQAYNNSLTEFWERQRNPPRRIAPAPTGMTSENGGNDNGAVGEPPGGLQARLSIWNPFP